MRIHHGVEAVELVAVGADGIVPIERGRAGLGLPGGVGGLVTGGVVVYGRYGAAHGVAVKM